MPQYGRPFDDPPNPLLVIVLGIVAVAGIIAATVLQALGKEPGVLLTATISGSVGGILALSRPPWKG